MMAPVELKPHEIETERRMLTDRILALAGAGLLIVGLFCPVMTHPFVGSINFFEGANVSAPTLLALALIGGVMALTGRERDTVWPGVAAAVMLLYHFVTLQFWLPQMRANVVELADTAFGSIPSAVPSAVQVQWGWLLLAASSGLLVYAGVRSRRRGNVPTFDTQDGPGRTVLSTAALLALGAIGWSLFPR